MVIAIEVAGLVLLAVAAVLYDPLVGVAACGVILFAIGALLDAASRPRRAKGDG